ncbi:cobyrinate a,c-diamide synthase [Devosia rhodophyticola]|uniref:Hydrogenobyrinate a,c-diamide synthase n=1 Tax=Devosia rhodophyticola TaxID=3026423 RepID=A0ABY7YZC8_9HYPH|nr:cobyrinate a,c-diamide synthase [Devosia rhodophyticola]WDR06587.1 cobyrinate a,c-diamide synthase [Devosia rhodophyticola]
MVKGLVIGAPRSGSGKTIVTLGLLAALKQRGIDVAAAKTGPDYIDPTLLARAAQRPAINLDPWAMSGHRLKHLASSVDAQHLLIEGVMGLFDGAADGIGSTGDLAELLELPVVLVVDADKQSQSIAPLVSGFANWRFGVQIGGVILNRVASTRHEKMLLEALSATGIPCLGAIPRNPQLVVPERHLGLVMPNEVTAFDHFLTEAAQSLGDYVDLGQLLNLAQPVPSEQDLPRLAPLGQHIAIARDDAFAFIYPHLLEGWRQTGAELSFFSPLADEAPDASADAVYLPGGYPELHGAGLAAAKTFKAGLLAAQNRDALIYGECGGFMVMGEVLLDKTGIPHEMAGLLPVVTQIDRPKRILGYRRLAHQSALPWPQLLAGHEFHYSSAKQSRLPPLFHANDARGEALPPMGAAIGRTMGSYAHVIDVGTP